MSQFQPPKYFVTIQCGIDSAPTAKPIGSMRQAATARRPAYDFGLHANRIRAIECFYSFISLQLLFFGCPAINCVGSHAHKLAINFRFSSVFIGVENKNLLAAPGSPKTIESSFKPFEAAKMGGYF